MLFIPLQPDTVELGEVTATCPYDGTIITMNSSDNNKDESFTAKRVKPRYINIQEDIYMALSGDALKVYIALRFESDYREDCSSVEKNILFLCNTAKVSRTDCFEALNDLENNGLLIRQPQPGKQSIYWVASDLNYFKHKENLPVQDTDGCIDPSRIRTTPVQNTDTIITNTTNTNYSLSTIEHNLYTESEQQRKALFFRDECLRSEKCQELYEKLPDETKNDKSFKDIYEECLSHYATLEKPLLVSPQRLMSWIKREIEYFKKQDIKKQSPHYQPKQTGTNNFNDVMRAEQTKGFTYVQ